MRRSKGGKAAASANDPTPALELLWGRRVPPRRGPKSALTLQEIVEAAVAIADTKGFGELSMRSLAEHLGIAAASLYTHVPGKAELVALMLDAAVGTERLPHQRPGTWRDKIGGWAWDDWEEFRSHPWALELASERPLAGPNLLLWLDSALRVLADTPLSEFESVATVHCINAYVRGHARLAVSADSVPEAWQEAQASFLERNVDMTLFPALGRVASAGGFRSPEAEFEFGLERLLDGVQSLIDNRSAGTRRDRRGGRTSS